MLNHFGLQDLGNVFWFLAHDALCLDAVDLNVVKISLTLCDIECDVDVLGGDLLGLDDVHVLELLDEPIELLNVLLVPVLHEVLDLCKLHSEVRTRIVEVLVPDLGEHGDVVSQLEVMRVIFLEFELLTNCLVGIHDLVINLQRASLDAKELIKQSLVVLADTEGRDEIDISIDHDHRIDFTLLILVCAIALALINV